jgi:hypothetical protein
VEFLLVSRADFLPAIQQGTNNSVQATPNGCPSGACPQHQTVGDGVAKTLPYLSLLPRLKSRIVLVFGCDFFLPRRAGGAPRKWSAAVTVLPYGSAPGVYPRHVIQPRRNGKRSTSLRIVSNNVKQE